MTPETQENILRALNAALQSRKLYPPGHPSVTAPARKVNQLLSAVLKEQPKLSICLVDDALVFEDVPVPDSEENYPDIVSNLKDKKVEAMIFEKGILEKEVFSLFEILSQEKAPAGVELQKELSAKGVAHITLKTIPIGKRKLMEVYNDAVNVVKTVMHEIRVGRIPESKAVKSVIDEMTELVFSDTNAVIGLTMIKNYDNYLYNHSVNVSILSLALGKFMNYGKEDLQRLGVASLLHDIGKTGVSEDIIKKPGGLSYEEWEKVKEHPVMGSKITHRMQGIDELICRVIFEHHVRFDRSGYPKVDSPTLHPLSLVVSVADAYDALTTLRVYQKPYQPSEAIKVLKGLSGKHFDPKTVSSFESMIGVYPVGTMVRLSTNEIAIVTKVHPEGAALPVVKVAYEADGKEVETPYELDLEAKGENGPKIICAVDPLSRNMDMGTFFEKEAVRIDSQN
ncbi:MAG: HD-GYP domain-containing protein [Thermodesulfobacteriota bacterium]